MKGFGVTGKFRRCEGLLVKREHKADHVASCTFVPITPDYSPKALAELTTVMRKAGLPP